MIAYKLTLRSIRLWYSCQSWRIQRGIVLSSSQVSTDASNTGMGTVLEQEQEEETRAVKRVIAYSHYRSGTARSVASCSTYYLTERHVRVDTKYASLTWKLQ